MFKKTPNSSMFEPHLISVNDFLNSERFKTYAQDPEEYNKMRINILKDLLNKKNLNSK